VSRVNESIDACLRVCECIHMVGVPTPARCPSASTIEAEARATTTINPRARTSVRIESIGGEGEGRGKRNGIEATCVDLTVRRVSLSTLRTLNSKDTKQ
jgi:hypothetical protein